MDWDWRTVQDAYKTLAHIHSLEREASESSIRDRLHKLNQQTKSLEKFKVDSTEYLSYRRLV